MNQLELFFLVIHHLSTTYPQVIHIRTGFCFFIMRLCITVIIFCDSDFCFNALDRSIYQKKGQVFYLSQNELKMVSIALLDQAFISKKPAFSFCGRKAKYCLYFYAVRILS